MKQLRQAILWTVLAAIGLVAALSVIGSFLGAESAKVLFNSAPLVFFWFVFLAMLATGFIFFRSLVATPAGLAMHLGTLLVVAGAMWGSEQAHAWRAKWLGSAKTPSGFMTIYRGQSDDRILDNKGQRLATLPQRLRLDDFWIDYYPWTLLVDATMFDTEADAGHEHWGVIPWNVGETVPVEYTPVRLTVLQYLNQARPAPGGAVADAAAHVPAMQVLLECAGRRQEVWFVPHPGEQGLRFDLGPLIRGAPTQEEAIEGPDLSFVVPIGSVKAYVSDVTVIDNDRPVATATIEVNEPMHWAGYHFYQHNYDPDNEAFTVLHVVSDSGLWAVYLGLFLLVAGAFGRFWLSPAWAYLFPGGSDGH